LKVRPVRHSGKRYRIGFLLAFAGIWAVCGSVEARGQGWSSLESASAKDTTSESQQAPSASDAEPDAVVQWEGKPVRRITFVGVSASRLAPLSDHLAQASGAPLNHKNLRKSLRQLYATGLYETVQIEGSLESDGVSLVFRGTPNSFIGRIGLDGVRGATLNTQLVRASQLTTGSRFTQTKLSQALEQIRRTLADNGFHEPVITQTLTTNPEEQLVDIAFHVVPGPQARVGTVAASGDIGMSEEDFRRRTRLKSGSRVNRETANRALAKILKHYQGQDRLEAEIKVEAQHYDPSTKKTNFHFSASQGPVVTVKVEGVKMSPGRIKRVIPVFEEGTVDDDLLNEGNRRLRDYFQRLGYFDVKIDHEQQTPRSDLVIVLYKVQLGLRSHVQRVSVEGNHYINAASLKELLGVHAADSFDRYGTYSQSLVTSDIGALQAMYQNNGFSQVKITPEISSIGSSKAAVDRNSSPKEGLSSGTSKSAPLSVVYRIEEGAQQRVGSVQLLGAQHVEPQKLLPLLNTAAGQLLSPQNLANDRDALLTDYLSRGFDQVQVTVNQQVDPLDANKVSVVFQIVEGQQIFVRKVLLTGLHYTRPATVAKAITLHPGDPLNETALSETQRNLYELSLFNEVDTAIENPSGGETYKTILLQAEEARRWVLTYGFGFEAETGTPQYNCHGYTTTKCGPNGTTGISPRVLLDVTRNNLFGREQSASLRGTYGLLEEKLNLLYQIPHFEGSQNFGLSFSGGYANSTDLTTYVATKLEGSVRLTESFLTPGAHLSKANTLVYELDFRRVKVRADSLQVAHTEIDRLATAVRVTGPAITWIRDTRDSPLDAHKGTYTTFQEFFSTTALGAQAVFNRLDLSNSSYYSFAKGRFVLARNMRYGQERSFGTPDERLIPLPERLYAGGAASLRSFGSNSAGPRDPQTGYPVGGAGALIANTELRLPPPTLPWVGNSVSLVLFHDMGNIFASASDAWISALRIHQPDRESCKDTSPTTTYTSDATGIKGSCSFNYFSHAPGIGMRYHTPVGPIRVDFSYNLNPPIYPIIYDYSLSNPSSNPRVGQAPHFNFFFSLGQTF